MEKLALVTGGLSHIGRNLTARLLTQGYQVRALDDTLAAGLPKPTGIELVEASITNEGAVDYAAQGASVIFHLADCSDGNTGWIMKNNISGTIAVLEAAKRNSSRVILKSVVVSQKEGTNVRPNNHYLASRLVAEQYVNAYARWHGMATVTLRTPEVFGKGSTSDILSRLVNVMLHEEHGEFPSMPRLKWDCCHIDDVVDAFLLASEAALDGSSINIASGESHSIHDMIRAIKLVVKTAHVPKVTVSTTDLTYVYSGTVDITRAKRILGYKPRVGFEVGLRRFINFILAADRERVKSP